MIIKNGRIFLEYGGFAEGDLYVRDGIITGRSLRGVKEETRKADGSFMETEEEVVDASCLYVIPGLTDLHFHGCVGYDFCDGTEKAIEKIGEYELQNGITTICPASMAFPEDVLAAVFETAADYRKKQPAFEQASLVGIHMEGPFLSPQKRGAHKRDYLQKPDMDMFVRLQQAAGGMIRLADLAPELDGAMEFIEKLGSQVRISLAHTMADYDTAMTAFEKGAAQVTHLYNAMPSYTHRAPGVVGAACDRKHVMAELICDGIHIHPAVVRATFQMFGDDRIIMISDSMRACGMGDGQYTLGGQNVTVKGSLAALTDEGNIAGSVTNLMDCVRTAVKKMGIPLASAIKCAAVNPAKALGIYDRYGSLEQGKTANIVMLDENLEIRQIVKDGKRYR